MVGLGTRSTIERVESGNSQPKAARASALPDREKERMGAIQAVARVWRGNGDALPP